MQYKNQRRVGVYQIFALLFALLSLPNQASAQDTSQSSGNQKPGTQAAPKDADNKEAEPASPFGLTWANSYIRQIGSAGLLAGSREGIGWGSLYIPSAAVNGIVDQFEATGATPATSYTAAVLQTTVVYDHRIGNGRFALQYQPS